MILVTERALLNEKNKDYGNIIEESVGEKEK